MLIASPRRYQKQTGAYSIVGKTGTMAAGLAAASPVFAFRWNPTTAGLKAVIDRVRFSIGSLAVAFAPGIGYLEAVAARAYTAVDYGGKAAPTTTSAVASESGGTLGAATYYYSLSALGAWGETALGTERSAQITGTTGSITFTYSNYTNATAHRVWRGTSTGVYTHYQDDAASTFVDTGAGWTAGTPGAVEGGGTGLTLTTNNAKRATSHATTQLAHARLSDTIALVAGTKTLDAQPFAAVQFTVPATVQTVLFDGDVFKADPYTHPIVFAANEGFIVRATIPATGTWSGVVTVDWREVL